MSEPVFKMDSGDVTEIVNGHDKAEQNISSLKSQFNMQIISERLNQLRLPIGELDPTLLQQHDSLSHDTIKPKTEELEGDIKLLGQRANEAKRIVVDWRNAVESTDEEGTARVEKVTDALEEANVNWEPSQ